MLPYPNLKIFFARFLFWISLVGFIQFNALGKPLNVVLLISDDLRPGLGCYGDTEVKPPT